MEKDRALNLLQNGLLPQVHGAYHDALKIAIEALQPERSSQFYNGGWIPCEDRVPVNDDYVFAWNGNPIVAYYDGEWYSNDGNFEEDISPITYWMPLPHKPEEVE